MACAFNSLAYFHLDIPRLFSGLGVEDRTHHFPVARHWPHARPDMTPLPTTSRAEAEEERPLLRPTRQPSYYGNANDSSITRYAAETAVGAEAEGGADPLHDHGGKDGRLAGDERVQGWDLALIL